MQWLLRGSTPRRHSLASRIHAMWLLHAFIGLALAALGGETAWRYRRSLHARDGRFTTTLSSGRRLEYTLWPPEAADKLQQRSVIVHLHGMVASGDDVQLMVNASTDPAAIEQLRSRVAIIGIDRPGFGGSDSVANGRTTLSDVAADVEDLIGALGVEQWGVVGFSAGGPVALALAARSPKGLRRLVTVASPWWWAGDAPSDMPQQPWADLAAAVHWPFHKVLSYVIGPRLLSRFVTTPGLAESLGTSMSRYYARGAWAGAWEATQLRRGAPFQLRDIAGRSHIVASIFQGTADATVTPDHGHRLASGLPQAELHLVDGADHFTIARAAHKIFAAAA